jgi:hypothetical protein
MELLVGMGYYVTRSAGSHGIADLIAIHSLTRPLLVQAKSGGAMPHSEWNELFEVADAFGATPLLLRWNNTRRRADWVQLIDTHSARSKFWPAVEWKCPVAPFASLELTDLNDLDEVTP